MPQDTPNYTRLFDATLDETAPVEGAFNRVGTLADYDLLEKIGEGGMGVIWKARKRRSGRMVALKQMRFVDAAMDSKQAREASARFEREIGLTSRLEHPGIARVYETGKDEKSGSPFFTMELVDGKPLTCEGCTIEEKVSLLISVCDAVAHAHRNGIIHRDLKPANVLVTADRVVKILDFGVARALQESEFRSDLFSEDPAITLSRAGEIFGTPQFMAPEQARGESSLSDTRTDVFALGALLFRLLTGKFAHSDEGGTWEVIGRVASGEVQRPNELSDEKIPSDLEAVLMKALSFAPENRYDSAGELQLDLENFLRGEPVLARPLTAAYWLKKHITRHSTEWFGGLVIFLTIIGFAVAWGHERASHLKEQIKLREKAQSGERSAKEVQSKSFVRIARDYRESGAKAEALPYLAQAIKLDPDNRIARASLAAAIKQFPNLRRASPTVRFSGVAKKVLFDPLGKWYVIAIHGLGIHFYDIETHELIREIPVNGKVIDMQIAPGETSGVAVSFRDLKPVEEGEEYSGSMFFVESVEGRLSRYDTAQFVSYFDYSLDGNFLVQGFGQAGDIQGGFDVVDLSDFTRPTVIARHRFVLPHGVAPKVAWAVDRQSVYFINGERDGRLHRCDVMSGVSERTAMMSRPPGTRPYPLRNFTISREGQIALSGEMGHLSMWKDDVVSGPKLLWSDKDGSAGTIRNCRFSGDQRYLSGASTGGRVIVWDSDTGEKLASLNHGERVLSGRFSPDPEAALLLTRSETDRFRLWDWRRGIEIGHPLEGGQRILAADLSPDGRKILVGRHQHARMWGVEPRGWKPVVVNCGVPLNALRLDSEKNRILATSYPAGRALVLSIPTGTKLGDWPHESIFSHARMVHRFPAEMSAGGRYFATAATANEVVVRKGVDFSEIRIPLSSVATALTFDPAGEILAIGDSAAETALYRLEKLETREASSRIQRLKGAGVHPWQYYEENEDEEASNNAYHNFVSKLSFASAGDRLVSLECPRGVYSIYDWKKGAVVGAPWVTGIPIAELKITPDGRFGVIAGDALYSRIIRLKDAKPFGPDRHHSSPIRKLGISANSRRFASASLDGQVKFWNIESTGENEPIVIPPQQAPVTSMAFSNDGFLCATGDAAGEIRLWLAENGESLCDPLDAGAAVMDLIFHEKYPLLIAACKDGTIRLWEIPSGIGRCTDEFATLAETMAGLFLTEAGATKVGATYQYDQMKANFYRRYQKQVQERALNSAYRADEYHRLAAEIFGFPQIEEPDWILQGD